MIRTRALTLLMPNGWVTTVHLPSVSSETPEVESAAEVVSVLEKYRNGLQRLIARSPSLTTGKGKSYANLDEMIHTLVNARKYLDMRVVDPTELGEHYYLDLINQTITFHNMSTGEERGSMPLKMFYANWREMFYPDTTTDLGIMEDIEWLSEEIVSPEETILSSVASSHSIGDGVIVGPVSPLIFAPAGTILTSSSLSPSSTDAIVMPSSPMTNEDLATAIKKVLESGDADITKVLKEYALAGMPKEPPAAEDPVVEEKEEEEEDSISEILGDPEPTFAMGGYAYLARYAEKMKEEIDDIDYELWEKAIQVLADHDTGDVNLDNMFIRIDYSGAGDSGGTDNIKVTDSTFHNLIANIRAEPYDELDKLAWSVIDSEESGFYNNDGGYGYFIIGPQKYVWKHFNYTTSEDQTIDCDKFVE